MALSRLTLSLAAAAILAAPAYAKDVKNVGISVGLLGNPFFVATIKGIEAKAKEITPDRQDHLRVGGLRSEQAVHADGQLLGRRHRHRHDQCGRPEGDRARP